MAREAATTNPDVSSPPSHPPDHLAGRATLGTRPGPDPWRSRSAAPADARAEPRPTRGSGWHRGSAGTTPGAAGQAGAGQATALPRQFAQVIVEILAGSRPLRQTVGWTTDRVRAQIGDLTQVLASDQRPRIRRIVTSQPAASVVEMTVVVSFGPRSRALAMRFEHMPARRPAPGLPARPARWLCTEIETG